MYEPREDSYLLEKHVRTHAKGRVLDMGTGSGIQGFAALEKADEVVAADINKKLIADLKKKHKIIKFVHSDLFSNITGKFDLIAFNPPYLPYDKRAPDIALDGGKKGFELTIRFIASLGKYLKKGGVCLLLFSTLTGKSEVDKHILKNLLEKKQIDKLKLGFEELFVYEIRKSKVLVELNDKEITNIEYFAKGHRGLVFTGEYKGKKVVVKCTNPDSTAINRMRNEANFLKKLEQTDIGPKVIFSADDYLVYYFIEGTPILDIVPKLKKSDITRIIVKVISQMWELDKLGINKEEMHKPIRHILIGKTVKHIDFERCHYSIKKKNVTQFCQFLITKKMHNVLLDKKISIDKDRLLELCKVYKKDPVQKNIDKIIGIIKDGN